VLEQAYLARCGRKGTEPVEAKALKERTKLGRAPLVVVVGAVRQPSEKISWDDQVWAVTAAAQNACLAATALGYGSIWRTGDPIYDEHVKGALGFGPQDAVVGFLYVGTPAEHKPGRAGSLDGVVRRWEP
jgi:nitroreductase